MVTAGLRCAPDVALKIHTPRVSATVDPGSYPAAQRVALRSDGGEQVRYTLNGSAPLAYDGEPNGLKFHPDGRAFIADYRRGIMVLDPRTGKVEPYLERARLESFKGCNDLFFASNGDLYFTDQGQTGLHDPSGRLFRLRASGQLDLVLKGIPSPNGLVMNLDETAVYLAVTRDNAIWRSARLRQSSSRSGPASRSGTGNRPKTGTRQGFGVSHSAAC